jgi:CRISPR/Cas system-associated endonuclease Cas1
MRVLYIDGHGASLAVHKGMLLADDQCYAPGSHTLKTIIMASGSGSVSYAAMEWLAREHIGCLIEIGSCEFAVLADGLSSRMATREQAMRLRQMACYLDPARRLEAARAIVRTKIDTLRLAPADRREAERDLARARTIPGIAS